MVFFLSLAVVLGVLFALGRKRREEPRAWDSPANDPTPMADIDAWFRDDVDAGLANYVTDASWRDLEGESLFRALDYTDTPLGRQRLYALLRTPVAEEPQRHLLEVLATASAGESPVRESVRAALGGLRGTGGYRLHRLLRDGGLTPPWAGIAPLLAAAIILVALLLTFWPKLVLLLIPLVFSGIVIRMTGLSRLGPYIGPLRELAPVLRSARQLAALVDTLPLDSAQKQKLRESLQPPSVPLQRIIRVARFVRPDFSIADEFAASLYEYVNLVLLLDVNALLLLGRSLRTHRSALEHLCQTVGLFDVAISVAAFRSAREWCRPTLTTGGKSLRFDGLRHPALPHGVANDIALRAGRGLLLTGANMSGKSTLLRALGTNVLLGRALNTCTALQADLPCTAVQTSIGHADDLSRGVSYFYAEASAVAGVLRAAEQERALFLFDELFRGTNAAERIAAAEMVMRAVVTGRGGAGPQWVALATHDLQLGELLADCFDVCHLAVDSDGSTLRFHYSLRLGPATTRTALALLQQCGVNGEILSAARARATELELSAASGPDRQGAYSEL